MKHGVVTPEDYAVFRTYLEQVCGILLGENKHYLVVSRLGRVMAEAAIETLGDLVRRLKRPDADRLREAVIDAMTTNETFWFRDTYPFDVLKSNIFPDLAQQRARPVRIWSAACSSGQEAYSVSMTAQEFLTMRPGSLAQIEIVGTDISPAVLQEAKQARYEGIAVSRGLSPERRERFFTQKGPYWTPRPEIAGRCRFTHQNLLQTYATLGRFHVIFCRNVLIYFSADSKRDIIDRMYKALLPGGYLFLGASENLHQFTDQFDMVRCEPGVVYRRKG